MYVYFDSFQIHKLHTGSSIVYSEDDDDVNSNGDEDNYVLPHDVGEDTDREISHNQSFYYGVACMWETIYPAMRACHMC
jgi:hypothetical protein